MERKIRNRVNTQDLQTMLMKLLPWIFVILLYLAAQGTTMVFAADGPIGSGMG
jgi:hypothetical protein